MPLNPTAVRGNDYRWLKWQAIGWLVFGRPARAEALFDEMLRRWPDDAYALSSRSHLRGQRGAVDAAIADAQALVAAHPERSAGRERVSAHAGSLGRSESNAAEQASRDRGPEIGEDRGAQATSQHRCPRPGAGWAVGAR